MIGRKKEIEILEKAYHSPKPELVAVLGRRRVGKTFLIRSVFEGRIDFEMVGLKDGNKAQQLRNFTYSLRDAKKMDEIEAPPVDWLEAFYQLGSYLDSLGEPDRRKVVFIDELPWVASVRSDFLMGFAYFWNSYVSKKNVLVVICGSATAWMIKNIINNKGGLHNRVTRRVHLMPFSLAETEAYFKARHIYFERYHIVQLYMTMGGIPHYLDQVEGGKSAVQNINAICFEPGGLLRSEFENLYSSLFSKPERYEHIVKSLASKWSGLSRKEILKATKLKDGGGLTTILNELEQSGFITAYAPFGKKKKDTLYRLTDNYSLFYLKFIQKIPRNESQNWGALSETQSWKSWSGYAFENICLQHVAQIKSKMGISGIFTQQFSYTAKEEEGKQGVQIDLLIDRKDNSISLCEIKFYNAIFVLSKKDAAELRRKKNVFKQHSGTKKQVFVVLVTTFGLQQNPYSLGLVDGVVDLDDLFW